MHVPASFLAHMPVLRQAKHTCGLPFFVFAVAFTTFGLWHRGRAGEVVFQGVFAVDGVFTSTDPVVGESPGTVVSPDRVEDITIVPEEPIHVEFVRFRQMPLKL